MTRDPAREAREAPAASGDNRRNLVPVYTVIEEPPVRALSAQFSRSFVLEVVKEVLDRIRAAMRPEDQPPPVETVVEEVRRVVFERGIDRLRVAGSLLDSAHGKVEELVEGASETFGASPFDLEGGDPFEAGSD